MARREARPNRGRDPLRLQPLACCACVRAVLVNVRLVSPQRCSPTVLCWFAFQRAATVVATVRPVHLGRLARPCDRSLYTYTASGRSPAQLAVNLLRCARLRPRPWPRMAPLVEFGGTACAISSGSSSRTRSCASASRRLCSRPIPRCFVGGIPPSRLAGVPRQMRRAGLGTLAQRASSPSKPPHPILAIHSMPSHSTRATSNNSEKCGWVGN